ncbi:MAG: hypothetical protein NZ561_01085 [Phycisphaerae bacterium]|nr:hypothetical protein [Phycisphaerae bacterium]MDW8262151.1 hypothetical protein [Phycisphaerales bacterium]
MEKPADAAAVVAGPAVWVAEVEVWQASHPSLLRLPDGIGLLEVFGAASACHQRVGCGGRWTGSVDNPGRFQKHPASRAIHV